MIIGASALIPDGNLYTEIDNKGKEFPVSLKDSELTGGIPIVLQNKITSFKHLTPKKQDQKQVIVLTNHSTSSAAEFLTIALKNNPNVITIGEPTFGLTSINTNQLYHISDNKAWWVIYTVGSLKTNAPINGKTIFNNEAIDPDITFDMSSMFDGTQDLSTLSNYSELLTELSSIFRMGLNR